MTVITGWVAKNCLTACSFGVKLLLLAGTVGFLSLAGFLQSQPELTQPQLLTVRQVGREASLGRVSESQSVTSRKTVPVNINQGSIEELQSLPGIGTVLAERVFRYRQENGGFTSVQDIQNVKGIGAKRFAQLRPYIRVSRKPSSPDE